MNQSFSKYLFVLFALVLTACGESPKEAESMENEAKVDSAADVASESETKECKVKNDFVPKGWKIVDETKGDLNKDGKADLVLIIQSTDPKKIEKDEYFTVDSNPRTLLILFAKGEAGCYELNTESKTFILPHTDMNMEDPYSEMVIKNGALRIKFVEFANAGTWEAGSSTYVWRFQEGDFKLIGASSTSYHRASGEAYDVSVNFSTGKYALKSYNMFDEEVEMEEEWKTLNKGPLQTFKTFTKPYTWKVNEDLYL